jgi:hypothetical protein
LMLILQMFINCDILTMLMDKSTNESIDLERVITGLCF